MEEGGGVRSGLLQGASQRHTTLLQNHMSLQQGMNFTSHLHGHNEKQFTTSPMITQKYKQLEADSKRIIEQYHSIKQMQHNEKFNGGPPHSAATGTSDYCRQLYGSEISGRQNNNDDTLTYQRSHSSGNANNYKDAPELLFPTLFSDSSNQGTENKIFSSTKDSFLHGQHTIGESAEKNHQHDCNYNCLLQCYQIQAKDLSYPNMKVCQSQRAQKMFQNVKHDTNLSDFSTTAHNETDSLIFHTDTNYELVVNNSESSKKPTAFRINSSTSERNPAPTTQCRSAGVSHGPPSLSLKMHTDNILSAGQTNSEKAKNLLYSKQVGGPEQFSVTEPNPMKHVDDKYKIAQQNNLQVTPLYSEEAPRQKGVVTDDRGLPLEKDQHNSSDQLKSIGTAKQNKSFGDSDVPPTTSRDEDMNVPDKNINSTTKYGRTSAYSDSYPPKRYFSSLEDNSGEVYNSSAYKNKKFKGSHHQQHPDNEDRQIKLAKIDQILEDFVPAMRTTNIPTEFVWQLIDFHKTGGSNGINSEEDLCKPSKTEDTDGGNEDVKERLNKKELLKYFNALEESFVKFARSNLVFKSLCEKDQLELLKRNSILFVMVRKVANYILYYLFLSRCKSYSNSLKYVSNVCFYSLFQQQ